MTYHCTKSFLRDAFQNRSLFILLFSFLLISQELKSQITFLGDNISAKSRTLISEFKTDGSLIYFKAITGEESIRNAFVSDGTEAGTINLTQNIDLPGQGVEFLEVVGNTLYFTVLGRELYKSDGTVAGTQKLADGFLNAEKLTAVGSKLFFVAEHPTLGEELWVSDGTESGTKVVKDIFVEFVQSANSSEPDHLMPLGNQLIFTAKTVEFGRELLISDGTESGTRLLKDIIEGTSGIFGSNEFLEFNGELYFQLDDFINGKELWKTDGTDAGTVLVKDIVSGSGNSSPSQFFEFNNELFFTANNELWKTDGSNAGTLMVSSIGVDLSRGIPVEFNGEFYYQGAQQLYKSDGTTSGTSLVKNFGIQNGIDFLGVTNSKLIFAINAIELGKGHELWETDGTTNGTQRITDKYPGIRDFVFEVPDFILVLNNEVFFSGDDGSSGETLWKTDGTEGGTQKVANISQNGLQISSGITGVDKATGGFLNVGNLTLYSQENSTGEIWKTDGSQAGTTKIGNSFNDDVRVGEFFSLGGNGYIQASSRSSGSNKLFFVNEALTEVSEITQVNGGAAGFGAVVNGKYIYRSNAEALKFGLEPYVTDGTNSGTDILKNINPGVSSSNPQNFISVGSKVYFGAFDNEGFGLWETDGTTDGTVKLNNTGPTFNGVIINETEFLYFNNSSLRNLGGELKTFANGQISFFESVEDKAFIVINSGNDRGVWMTNGTTAGTVKISSSFEFDRFIKVGSFYYMISTGGRDLYRTDGTMQGTELILSGEVTDFINFDNQLYLARKNLQTQNTTFSILEEDPVRLVQMSDSEGLSDFHSLHINDDKLYFRANHPLTGTELYVYEKTLNPAIALSENSTSANGSLVSTLIPNGFQVDLNSFTSRIGGTSLGKEITSSSEFVISNIGGAELTFPNPPVFSGEEADAFEFVDFPTSVAAGTIESFKIKYTGGENDGNIIIEAQISTNDPLTPTLQFEVYAKNDAKPIPLDLFGLNPIEPSSRNLEFPQTITGEETTDTIYVANNGFGVPLTINDIIFSGENANDFSVKEILRGESIQALRHFRNGSTDIISLLQNSPEFSARIVIAYSPTGSGTRKAKMTLDTNQPDEDNPNLVVSFDLQGTGTCLDVGLITPAGPEIICKDSGESVTLTIPEIDGAEYCWGESGWNVQDTLTTDFYSEQRFTFDKFNTPILGIRNSANKANVYKYENNDFVQLGNADFATIKSNIKNNDLGLDKNFDITTDTEGGEVFMAISDDSQSGRLTVFTFDGTNWNVVGSAGLSDGLASQISMDFSSDGNLYVAFNDAANFNRATVMQYDGVNWNVLGKKGLTTASAKYIDLEVSDDVPYLAFSDGAIDGGKATLLKYESSAWSGVGNAGFSSTQATAIDLEFDNSGIPYVGYMASDDNSSPSGPIFVSKLNGTQWETVGNSDVGVDLVSSFDLEVNGTVPNVFYGVGADSGFLTFKEGGWLPVTSPIEGFTFSVLASDNNGVLFNATRSLQFQGVGFTGFTLQKLETGNCLSTTNTLVTSIPGTYQVTVTIPGSGCVATSQNTVEVRVQECLPEVAVLGNGVSISNGASSRRVEDNTLFNPIQVGQTVSATYQIVNTGLADLELTLPLTLSGTNADQFSVSKQPESATVVGEDTVSFDVSFSPDALGLKTATVNMVNNVSGQSPFTYNIGGMSTSYNITLEDRIFLDNNNDNKAGSGDILEYTVSVDKAEGSGPGSSTFIGFNNPPPGLTLEVGSVTTSIGTVLDGFGNTPGSTGVFIDAGNYPENTQSTITFRMLVNETLPANLETISLQLSIGENSNVVALSDDPDASGLNDPTLTEIGSDVPTLVSAAIDNNAQITVTFSDNVQTNETNPTDFTITDAAGNTYEVSAQSNGTAGNTDIVLTVADMSQVTGAITVTYTNNNNEISDAATGAVFAETDATGVVIERPFITKWNFGSSRDATIYTYDSETYDYTIDWGDGTIETNQTGDATHTYAAAGDYFIEITGTFPGLHLGKSARPVNALQSVEQWGSISFLSMREAFKTAQSVQFMASDAPDLTQVTDMSSMLQLAADFNSNINHWDVSNVTDMSALFNSAQKFNQPLSNWDVSKVTNMYRMFEEASAFNQDIDGWDVGNVTDMSFMFKSASVFNQPLNSWNVMSVTNFEQMFQFAREFNQPLNNWDTSNALDIDNMFTRTNSFNQALDDWNVSNVTSMDGVFDAAIAFNQDLNSWDVSNVTIMEEMFDGATNFNGNITNWDVSSVVQFDDMFYEATSFNQDISGWDVSSAIDLNEMFRGATTFDQNLGSWNVTQATNLSNMFRNAGLSVDSYDATLNGWAAQNVQTDITLGSQGLKYSSVGKTGREQLIENSNWTIQGDDLIVSLIAGSQTATNEIQLEFNKTLSIQNLLETDFSVTDASNSNFTVTGVDEGVVGDAFIILDVDVSLASGSLTVSYINNNDAILDADTETEISRDASITVQRPFITTWNVTDEMTYPILADANYTYDFTINWGDGSSQGFLGNGINLSTLSAEEAFSKADAADFSLEANQDRITADVWITRGNNSGLFNYNEQTSYSSNPSTIEWALGSTADLSPEDYTNDFGGALNNQVGNIIVGSTVSLHLINEDRYFDLTFTSWSKGGDGGQGGFSYTRQEIVQVNEVSHTYANAGEYSVSVTGILPAFSINSGTEKDKLESIDQWGSISWVKLDNAFKGASNMTYNALDVPDLSRVTELISTFQEATSFNGAIGNWDVSTIELWNNAFSGASSFDQNLGNWDMELAEDLTGMLDNTALSKANYDATLTGWAQQNVQSNVTLGAEGLVYCTSASDRQSLIDNNSWTITDAGEQCAPSMVSASLDSDTQITVTFNQNVQTNGGNPTDFTVTDAAGATYVVSAQADGTAGDTDIVLTVADMSQVTGLITVTYANNNNEISDADTGTQFAETDDTGVVIERAFITTWTTTSANESITIPTSSNEKYDYDIRWGDDEFDEDVTGDATHTYPVAGTYEITITGRFPRIWFAVTSGGNKLRLSSVEQWGSQEWSSMEQAFTGAENLVINASDAPDLSTVTVMDGMFRNAKALNQDISHWDVSNVVDFEQLFDGAESFNQPLDAWDVSSATDMERMFDGAIAFNQDLNSWDVSNVLDMEDMFKEATAFNGNIGSWDVSSVTSMDEMFRDAAAFNQSLNNWDLGSVTTTDSMFEDAISFNGDISSWDVSNVTQFGGMFEGALAFNQDISQWDVSSMVSANWMFAQTNSFNQDIGGWNVSSLENSFNMFNEAQAFNQDISSWNTSSLTGSGSMFKDASLFNQDLSNWDISNVTDMSDMFSNSGMSRQNYDNTLIGFSTQTVQNGVTLGATGINYCDGATARQSLIDNNGWTITDAGELCAPSITQLAVPVNDNYGIGDVLEFVVTFDLAVNITGSPQLPLTIGSAQINADFVSDGTDQNVTELSFQYKVVEGDLDTDGIVLGAAMDLNGGSISDNQPENANLTLNNVASTAQVLVDGIVPAAPIVTSITDDTGFESDDQITNDVSLTFTGTAEANSTVTIFINGNNRGTATADGSGDWSFDSSAGEAGQEFAEGAYTVTATVTDAAGNTSASSADFNLTVDTTAPVAPTLDLDASTDLGLSDTDNLTSGNTFTFNGTAEPNSFVEFVSAGGAPGESTTANGNGEWSITSTGTVPSTTLPLFVRSTDLAGNISQLSTQFNLTIDQDLAIFTTSPVDEEVDVLPNANLTITFDKNVIKGTGNITIHQFSDNSVIETIDVTGGNVTIDGATVTIDPVDNILPPDTDFYVNIDPGAFENEAGAPFAGITDNSTWNFKIIAASVVTNVEVPDDGAYKIGDELDFTVNMVLPVTVTGSPRLPITIGDQTVNATLSGTAANTSSLTFIYTVVEGDLDADGIVVGSSMNLNGGSMRDEFGVDALLALNNIESTVNVLVDGIVPAAAVITGITGDTGASATDGITNDDTNMIVSGTAEAGARIELSFNGTTFSGLPVDANGDWSVDLSGFFAGAEGTETVSVIVTDAAGNSSATITFDITYDTTAPTAPTIDMEASSDSGISDSDNLTNNFTPEVSGTAEAGSTVEVTVDGSALGTTIADTDGNWSFTIQTDWGPGLHEVTATATDVAGNESIASSTLEITLDPISPTITEIAIVEGDGFYKVGETVTIAATFTEAVLVTGEPHILVDVIDGGHEAVYNGVGSGTSTIQFEYVIEAGHKSEKLEYVSASSLILDDGTIKDAAGNDAELDLFDAGEAGSISAEFDIVIDTEAPAAAVITGITGDTGASATDGITNDDTNMTVSGTAEAGARIELSFNGTTFSGLPVDANGDWSVDLSGFFAGAEGTETVSVIVTDAAGNSSATSTFDITYDTTAPAAPTIDMEANSDSGISDSDNLTNNFTPEVSGTAEAGSTVEVTVDGSPLGTATADTDGNWSFTIQTDWGPGLHEVTATATDVAGNESVASATLEITLDISIAAPSLSPADNQVDVLPSENLTMTFEEDINKGTGNITIKLSSDDSTLEEIDVTSAQVSISGGTVTIDPNSSLLPPATEFYVMIDGGVFTDNAGNDYAGINNNTDWTFTSIEAAVITSITGPANDVYIIGEELEFTVNYSLPVTITSGYLLPFTLGTSSEVATVGEVSSVSSFVMSYTVEEGDLDTDGLDVGSALLKLNRPSRMVDDFGTDALLETNNVADLSGVLVDGVRPTPTLSTSIGALTNTAITATITFDEAITGLELTDLTITNGAASDLEVVTAGTVWTVTITPSADGQVTVSLPAGAVNDVAGNTSAASTNSITTTFDGTAPTITSITRAELDQIPTGTLSIDFTVIFSEAVTGVDVSDFEVVTTGTATGSVNTVTENSGTNYTVNVNGLAGEGTIGLNAINDNSIIDNATNALGATFTGEVYTTNFASTDIGLSSAEIQENNAVGDEIGTLTSVDADAEDTFTYSLVSGAGDADNASFSISGDKLLAGEVYDFETKSSYSIRVRTTDNFAGSYEEVIIITITNEPEAIIVVEGDGTFDQTILGLSTTKSWTVTNFGDVATEVRIINTTQGFGINPGSIQVNPGDVIPITAVFTPTEARTYNGVAVFNYDITDDIQDNVIEVNLTGEGVIVTGVDNGQFETDQIEIYPNPAQEFITIDLSDLNGIPVDIQVTSPTGVSTETRKAYKKSKLRLNVMDYTNGVYIIQFSNDRSLVRKKVIIRK